MRVLFFLIFFSLSSLGLAAQPPAKVLKRAEQVLGGAKALRNIASWQKRGTIKRLSDGATGKIVISSARPNLYNIGFDIDGFEIEAGYNGKSSWTRDSRNGLRTLTGDPSVDFQSEAAFRSSLWLDSKKDKSRIVSSGTALVSGSSANVLVMTKGKGSTVRLFFDAGTGLLVKEEFSAGDSTRGFEYSDFQKNGGVSQARKMKIEIDGVSYEVVLDDVRANAQIARSEFDFPPSSGDPLPEIASLLKDVQTNQDKVEEILDTYSYVQKRITRELGKDGTLREKESETSQLSFYKGYRISRLIEKNGKPLSAKDQADEDKKAGERVEEIEKEITKRETETRKGPPSGDDRRISIGEMLRASTLLNPRRERFRDRNVIVFDFEPNPSFDYKNAKSMLKFFGKTAGAIWIDENDKQVARIEAFLADSFNIGGGVLAKLKKGASFTIEQERINDEIWLPSVADINLSVRVLLVKGIDVNQVIRSYDYRKFSTEIKDAKVDEIKGKPSP